MNEKDYLSKFSSIDESIRLSDDKLEQIEGGACDVQCKKCVTQKNTGHDTEIHVPVEVSPI